MKAERPALGISRSASWGDAEVYNIECSCTDSDHTLVAWIEISPDSDIPEVEVTLYVNTNFRRFRNLRERVRGAWGILFGNGHEQHHSLLLTKQAALNVAAALEQSIEDLENRNLPPTA